MAINLEEAALDVVEACSKNKIPIAMMQSVFDKALDKAAENTIPYSPKRDNTAALAISDITSKVTEPSG